MDEEIEAVFLIPRCRKRREREREIFFNLTIPNRGKGRGKVAAGVYATIEREDTSEKKGASTEETLLSQKGSERRGRRKGRGGRGRERTRNGRRKERERTREEARKETLGALTRAAPGSPPRSLLPALPVLSLSPLASLGRSLTSAAARSQCCRRAASSSGERGCPRPA